MSPPETRNGAPAQGPAAQIAAASTPQDRSQPTAIPTVQARLYAPSCRRTLPLLIVLGCPFCPEGRHVHRGQGGVRRAGCGRGEYSIQAIPVIVGRVAA